METMAIVTMATGIYATQIGMTAETGVVMTTAQIGAGIVVVRTTSARITAA